MNLKRIALNIITLSLLSITIGACSDDDNKIPKQKLVKLLDDGELLSTYKDETNHTTDKDYFGIYPMIASGSTLYLGLGSGLPAGKDGALLAKYTEGDSSLTMLKSINEQGIMSFSPFADGISVPGVDPCCGDLHDDNDNPGRYNDEWDWGNFYTINTNNQSVIKHRNLPNVVHGWGSWYDKNNQTLYYAGSSHLADAPIKTDATTTGVIYKTNDFGENWELVANRDDGVGLYRSYDVIGIHSNLYVQHNDNSSGGDCGIAKSDNDGQTWTRITNSDVWCATRLYNIQNHLVVLASDGKSFIKINTSDQVSTHTFDPLFAISAYHTLSHDSSGNVYVGTTDGRVMHSKDLSNWDEIAQTDDDTIAFNTSTYWPEKKWLILSNWGDEANLWKLPVNP